MRYFSSSSISPVQVIALFPQLTVRRNMTAKPLNGDPEFIRRLHISQIELIFRQGPLAYIAIFVNSFLYVFFSWEEVPHAVLITWIFILYAGTILRWVLQRSWHRIKSDPGENDLIKIIRIFKIGVVFSGTVWGMTSLFWIFSTSEILLVVTTFILAGMTAGAVAAYSAFLSAVYSFLSAALLPLVVVLFFINSLPHRIMAFMALLYWALMMIIGRNANRMTHSSIDLGLRNEDLINRMHDASHEIRTPVAAIAGFAEIMMTSEECSGEIQEYVRIINRNSLYLKKLVENLLQYSQTHQPVQPREWISVPDQIDSAISIVEKIANEREIEIVKKYGQGLPKQILTDGLKFEQILINLLSNSIKFSTHGKVTIQVKEGRPAFLSIRIKDQGIGIGREAIRMVFKPFFRENRLEVRHQEGSGLGLALSRKLARSLGGDIHLLETEVGKGSVFEFEVPTGLPPRRSKQILSGRRIMIVDDSLDIQILFKNVLQAQGADVTICTNGSEAVEIISRDFNYDLILMDLNMPVMDGYTATDIIRKKGFTKPIVAFTAYSEKEKCLEFGFDGFMNKSEGLDNIIATIERQILLADGSSGRQVS